MHLLWKLSATATVTLSFILSATCTLALPPSTEHIKIDQFGYRTDAEKFAVISDPQVGFNSGDSFNPSATYEVRRVTDDTLVFSGPVVAWNGGAVHVQSGDRAYRFDFSALTAEDDYYVYDPGQDLASFPFRIDDDVYAEVLRQAGRTYFYQRCGAAKTSPFAGDDWQDAGACHLGSEQDLDCRAVGNPVPATSRDLHGGWHDAGDYNKYVNFADEVVHELLFAFEESPNAFGDDWNLPESGNGVPDLLDELRVELDWFLRMQQPDGSLLHKVSVAGFEAASPPSADGAVRRYAPATASATISGCGAFAHAARVFRSLGDSGSQDYADLLESAALSAWNWLEANPSSVPSFYDNAGFSSAPAEDTEYQQFANRVIAAAYLFALTGDTAFRQWVDTNVNDVHLMAWQYAYEFEAGFQDGLLFYSSLDDATPSVAANIRNAFVNGTNGYASEIQNEVDAYGSPITDGHYVWGSNAVKARKGGLFANLRTYGLDPGNEDFLDRATERFVHYFHGVNPMGLVYLTHMDDFGAESSTTEFYHSWFSDGTDWDSSETSLYGPAPGFLPGGPNPFFSPDPSYNGPPLEPPLNQPAQKSYRDWNTSWPENSWEITENSITYQCAYIKLLSRFVDAGSTTSVPESPVQTRLGGFFPNPAGDRTEFRLRIEEPAELNVDIFDIHGRRVHSLARKHAEAGTVRLGWDTSQEPRGLYFYRVRSGNGQATGRIVLE